MSRSTDSQTIEQLRYQVRQLQRDRDQLWDILSSEGLLDRSSVARRLPRLPVPAELTPEEFYRLSPDGQWLAHCIANPALFSRRYR